MSEIIEDNLVENDSIGTENNPYLISDKESLCAIQNNLAAHYKLIQDIDLGEEEFTPIGIFTGVLDGAGHSIKNLKVNRTVSYSGLFSQTKGAVIKHLLLENVSITSTQNYVGALVGHMEGGQIKGCAMEGAVTGYGYTGGLVGYAYSKATVEESGAFGSVRVTNTGSNYGGGLVGYGNSITIRNSYAACGITGNGKGLAYCSSTTVENSYYDGQRAGTGRDDTYNISKLTSGLIRRDFFKDWDFEESWAIEEGAGYPYPKGTTKEVFATESGVIEGGMGTEDSPYLLGSRAGVDAIRYDLAGHYRLSKDIDLGEEVFAPIGIFTGVLDGAGHSIKNLKVNGTVSYSGLFSQTKEAVIKHLLLENVSVTSTQNYVGALVGHMEGGQIKGCAMEGAVTGYGYTGGLAGYAYSKAIVEESGALGSVKSTSTGSSSNYTGGLVGYGSSITIRNSYAACEITGNGKGLAYCGSTTVENSYYDGQRTGAGRDDTYNISKLTSGLIRRNFFQDWDFEESWAIEEGAGYPYPKGTTKEVFATDSGVIEGGMGTEESPYLLGSRESVDAIRYDLAGHYQLSKDIDLGEEVFTPIGIFMGILDGAGHSIKNLKVNRTVSYSGLFSQTKEAVIKHLLLENVSVTSTQNYVGALVGQMNGGQVKGCAMEGAVTGYGYTGGLVGYVYGKATIEESGAFGSVRVTNTGSNYGGGLVGYGSSITLRNSYAACEITGNGKGLAYCSSSTVENSYYDGQRAGTGRDDTYNISKLTSGLIRRDFFKDWDFEESWAIEEGAGYPYPKGTTKEVFATDSGVIEGGMGTEESPYLLGSREGMDAICYELAGYYRLSKDIDLGEEEFTPIGIFTGVLDGAGHSIKNLKENRTVSYSGLFSQTKGAVIKRLLLENVSINSTSYYVGALIGYMNGGQVKGCAMEGTMVGAYYTGGLVGYAYNKAMIEESGAVGNVKSTNTGSSDYTGGLVGYGNSITIRNSYAACEITGKGKGLVYCAGATVENSYYDGQRAGTEREDTYNISKLTSGLIRRDFFQNWDFEESWAIEEGAGYPYPRGTTKEVFAASAGVIEGGSGTEESPYLLGSRASMEVVCYELAGHYRLSQDIDLGEEEFMPIGVFKGVLDGWMYTIKNLKQTRTADYTGLFSEINNATIRNLQIKAAVVSGGSYTGILAGKINASTVTNIFVKGTLSGGTNGSYCGGLVGDCIQGDVRNCKAEVSVSGKDGLVSVYSSTTIENSYFDSTVSGYTGATEQAKTTEELMNQSTFLSWDVENIWKFDKDVLPELRVFIQESYRIESSCITSVSVQLKCPDYEDAEFYLLSCDERIYRLDKDSMIIENLLPGKEYTLRLQIQLTSGVVLLSDELKIKTRSFIGAGGLHSVQKGTDFIQMQWDTILEAAKYEIYCNGKKYETVENTLKLDNLQSNVPYHIYLRVIFNDGSIIVSEAIIEKIYEVVPETEYATDFIEKCDGENWFIDVLEYLLNQKGKSINWISSKKDLENIFVINLKSRGIAGKIPRAIGDLKELRYIYLEGNDISTDFPEELSQLNKLILFDLIS